MSESPRGYLSLPNPASAHKAREDLVVRGLHLWALAYRDRPLHGAHHRGGRPSLHSFFGSWGLLALGLPLLPLAIPLHEGALHLGNDIRVGLGVLDALPNREQRVKETGLRSQNQTLLGAWWETSSKSLGLNVPTCQMGTEVFPTSKDDQD